MQDPYEVLVCDMFRRGGWRAEVTQHQGDHGIDVVAEKDDTTFYVQCKYYAKNVGEPYVRELYGVLAAESERPRPDDCAIGAILVAPMGFTNEAHAWAEGKGGLTLMTTMELSKQLGVPILSPRNGASGISAMRQQDLAMFRQSVNAWGPRLVKSFGVFIAGFCGCFTYGLFMMLAPYAVPLFFAWMFWAWLTA